MRSVCFDPGRASSFVAAIVMLVLYLGMAAVFAQTPENVESADPSPQLGTEAPATVFEHPDTTRFWLSGQANVIFQYHPPFHAAYSGPHSLKSSAENATSYVVTLFGGYQLTDTTEVLLDIEATGGGGLSDALGLGGFTDLDVVRNPDLTKEPYIARGMVRQIIPLSDERVGAERTPLSLATSLPARRLEIRVGKMGLPDFLDLNAVGSDSHLQFMNWTVDQNGAWDFAADTRGYTYAVLLEYYDHNWAARFAEGMMPTTANGIHLDFHLDLARAENVEFEHRHQFLGREGAVRLLAYVNHAHMGNYRQAINAFRDGRDPAPDITAHEAPGRTKYGFGLNVEQALSDALRVFGRLGWSDGQNETFAFTEVDRSGLVGADLRGTCWHREDDKVGLALSVNGLSNDHREYLALGGQGFILGEGRLNYNTEQILETYYTLHAWRGVFVAADLQYIRHPGYNRDRGPVIVPGFRFHVDF
ncbi:MAG: carbohydrate porin [Candidatus Binatia bacterium]